MVCEWLNSFLDVRVTFSVAVLKYPNKSNLRERGLILSLRVSYNSSWRGRHGDGSMRKQLVPASTVKKQRVADACAQLGFSFCCITPAQRTMPPTFRVDPPTLLNLLKIISQAWLGACLPGDEIPPSWQSTLTVTLEKSSVCVINLTFLCALASDALELGLHMWVATWVLRIEPGSSRRAVNALNH